MIRIVEWVKSALSRAARAFRKENRPVEHLGATETFGAELRALRASQVSPELVSDIETELEWGQTWYEFERTMQAAIDQTFAPYLPEPEVHNFDELREQVGLHEDNESRRGCREV